MTPQRSLAPPNLHAALKRTIKHFILVMDSLGDREMRWLNQGANWNRAINEQSAYGYTPQSAVRMQPTSREVSQAEIVASWLSWLDRTEGPKAVPRLVDWSHDEPAWRMADRERCSVRTITNRIDRSVAAILREFGGVSAEVATVEEGPDKPVLHFATRGLQVETGVREGGHSVVWIDGLGPMKDGRRVNRWAPLGDSKLARFGLR